MPGLVLAARLLLAAVLAAAGVGKLLDRSGSRLAFADFGVPERATVSLAWLLPILELGTAAALLAKTSFAVAALFACTLLVTFSGVIGLSLVRGKRPDCHCFGQLHTAPAGGFTLARNLFLLVLAVFVVTASRSRHELSAVTWMGALSPDAVIFTTVGCGLTLFLLFQSWVLFHLLRQNGRLANRVSQLEAGLPSSTDNIQTSSPTSPSHAPQRAKARPRGLALDSIAPSFTLPTIDGRSVGLEALRRRGRPVILIFSDPLCGPCKALAPSIVQWRRDYGHLITLAVISRGSLRDNETTGWATESEYVLVQADREVAQSYLAGGTPAAVRVGEAGRVTSSLSQGAREIEELIIQTVYATQISTTNRINPPEPVSIPGR